MMFVVSAKTCVQRDCSKTSFQRPVFFVSAPILDDSLNRYGCFHAFTWCDIAAYPSNTLFCVLLEMFIMLFRRHGLDTLSLTPEMRGYF